MLTFGAGSETGTAVSITCDYLSDPTNQFVVSNPDPICIYSCRIS